MILASQLRNGMAIQFEGHVYKVLAAEYHLGQGKMGGSTHTRLQNLDTGTFRDYSFRADLKLEDLQLEKRSMDFLYSDESTCYFMDPSTCEQVGEGSGRGGLGCGTGRGRAGGCGGR